MKLVVFSTSRPFQRFLSDSLEISFEFRQRLQAPERDADQLYLLHLSSLKLSGFEWMLKHVSGGPARVAVCSDIPVVDEMLEAVRLGARAYCHSHMAATNYRQMLRLLGQGQSWFPPHMLEQTFKLAQQAIRSRPGEKLLQNLTTREREISLAVADGKSNREVADLCAISEATVKTHLTSIFRKLEVRDRVGLVLLLKRG